MPAAGRRIVFLQIFLGGLDGSLCISRDTRSHGRPWTDRRRRGRMRYSARLRPDGVGGTAPELIRTAPRVPLCARTSTEDHQCFAVDLRAGDGVDGWVFSSSRTTTMDAIGRGAGSPLARGPASTSSASGRMKVGRHAGLRSTHKADDQDNQQDDHQKPNESVARPSNSKRQHVASFRRSAGLSPQDAGILGISGARAFAGAIGRGTRIPADRPPHHLAVGDSWRPAPSSAYRCHGAGPHCDGARADMPEPSRNRRRAIRTQECRVARGGALTSRASRALRVPRCDLATLERSGARVRSAAACSRRRQD